MEAKIPRLKAPKVSDRVEQLYTMLLDSIPSSVLLMDQDLRLLSANRNFLEKSHRTLSNTIGEQLERVLPEVILDQLDISKRIQEVIKKNQPIRGERMTYRAPGVPIRTYYYSILPCTWEGKVEGAILLMDDVTEQIRLGDEVRLVERRLASIVESASDMFISTDRKGTIQTWNPAAERLSGYVEAEVRGRSFFETCTDQDKEEVQEIFTLIDKREVAQVKECLLRTKQSHLIPVSWAFSPLKDSLNQTVGVVAVGRDLTEKRKFDAEFMQSQKLAALGVMAGGIAHEIRNPLTVCSSSAQFLLDDDQSPEFRRDCVEKILKGIQRAASIIESLLKYSRSSLSTETSLVDLVPLIRETATLVTYDTGVKQIEVKTSFSRESIAVEGVATLLQQVFMNLFLNAIQAMPDGGLLKIKADAGEAKVHVCVSDTGSGISPEGLEKVFDPFYTTSTDRRGTGLGLAICYSVVEQHGGTLEVESTEGEGSTFTVNLPLGRDRGDS
ncbi:MAG: PAS domain S-box protein [Longimicrobiales bacterium]|nr:PAS domain S-box protein [Longimicrobiales bacterium]